MIRKVPIRSLVIAPKDKLLIAIDLSQAETWIVAYLADEETMQYELKFGDIHSRTARSLFDLPPTATKDNGILPNQRYIGKRWNHSSSYRAKYLKLAEVVNKDSDKPPFVTVTNKEAKLYSERWAKLYHLQRWWQEIEEKLARDHFLITSYGRKRYFYSPLGDELYKEATAFEPQSTIADHMFGCVQKELGIEGGLISIHKHIVQKQNGVSIINTSHDSAILEVPKDSAMDILAESVSYIRRPLVVNGHQITIPCDAEIGERWGEMEKVKV